MKICDQCGQVVAEEINTCPTCGADVVPGRTSIDDLRILNVLHEGYSSILCKACHRDDGVPVMIRLFTPDSGVDSQLADRLRHELEQIRKLPETYFVRHLAIRKSTEGLWYRISEWVDALNWGTLLSAGRLRDPCIVIQLFHQIAAILDGLHRIGHIIPHLILDDILVYEDDHGDLKVKIDYKLSRFLDPQLDRPGPNLARLLTMHPDIVNRRPLDRHSDIWSLGKIFVEILCADPGVTDLHRRVDELPVPEEVRTLIRLMLSDDPDLRPHTMGDVAAALAKVDDRSVRDAAKRRVQDTAGTMQWLLRRINVRLAWVAVLVGGMIAVGSAIWYHLGTSYRDSEAALIEYANQYAASVAFVVVDYWLKMGDRTMYRNRTEGTAFLADEQGHLLTNRHVACPWLEDGRLSALIGLLGQRPEKMQFGYRLYLWFDGQRAFSRLPALADSEAVEDVYITETAFSTNGLRRVRIAGVAPVPVKTRERIRSPLRDDFAVLKIDGVPAGLKPLPLARRFRSGSIPKLTPLMTLGFPLGSRTQAETVNVSVTTGHVRRAFDSMFQVDTSLHPGNSGGPFIDAQGQVVGLASIVAVAWAGGPIPVATPLSDIGLVLPITTAAAFLDDLRTGHVKWNGEIDVALERRLNQITDAARRRQWAEARNLSDEALKEARTPPLYMAAAVMHLCAGDEDGARQLLGQVLSIDPERHSARLMILLIDALIERPLTDSYLQSLVALDWRSPDEFLGYLARMLNGAVDVQSALSGGYTPAEQSWLNLVAGWMQMSTQNVDTARPLIEKAALLAEADDWSLYLALYQLDRIQHRCLTPSNGGTMDQECRHRADAFDDLMEQTRAAQAALHAKKAPIQSALHRSDSDLGTKRALLKTLYDVDPNDSEVLVTMAAYAAMDDDWDAALGHTRAFLARSGRASADKLSLGLMEPLILCMQGQFEAARDRLNSFHNMVPDPWYRAISGSLLDGGLQAELVARADQSPEHLLTGRTALGLWAEGQGDTIGAARHYREALTSYVDHRIEYDLAMGRLKGLRKPAD